MPKITLEIPEVHESITRPVAMKVLDDLVAYMNLPEKPPVVFTGATGVEKHPGTAIGSEGKQSYMFNAEAKIMLEISEEYPEEYALQKAQLRPEEIVVFSDDALGVWLKPMYQPVTCTMTFHVRTASRSGAIQIMQNWKKLVSRGKQDYIHNVTYHYPVPLPMMAILGELHRLRENVEPYGEDVGTWMRNCFSPKMTVLTDQAGKNAYVVIRENQIGVMGWYDFNDSPPNPEKDNDAGGWGLQLTYKFQYDRCEGMAMEYPLMVHNQLLDDRFYDKERPYELENFHAQPNLSRDLFNKFAFNNQSVAAWSGRPGLAIPYFDSWLADYEYPSTQCIMRLLLQVDPNDRHAIITLTELGEWEIDADALAYIADAGNNIFIPGGALFHFVLYKGQQVVDLDSMRIDADLTVTTQLDLQLRDVHHLQMSILYDLQMLRPDALQALARHGEFAIRALTIIDPSLEAKGQLPTLNPDGTLSVEALRQVAFLISQRRWLQRAPFDYRWWLVGQFVINAHRRG